jgi:hypothetical protein
MNGGASSSGFNDLDFGGWVIDFFLLNRARLGAMPIKIKAKNLKIARIITKTR